MRLETILFDHCRRHPQKDALVCAGERISFHALEERVLSLAAGLRQSGIWPGDRVVLYLPNGVEFVELLFACFTVGATAVPVTTRLTQKEVAYFCDDSSARLIVCHAEQSAGVAAFVAEREALSGVVAGGSHEGLRDLDSLRVDPDGVLPSIPLDYDECMVMYTSGTTGRPKGVLLTHANILIQHGFMNGVEWRIGADDIYLVVAPMAHRSGLGRLMNAMTLGGTLNVMTSFDADRVLEIIERERVTVFGMVPTMCRMLLPTLEKAPQRCASLRRLVVTGEAFPVTLKQRMLELLPDMELVSFFGMTEAGSVTNLSHREQFTHPGSVGRAAPGVEVRIVDVDSGKDVEVGGVGELLVRSGRPGAFTVMKGYLNRPEDTARVLQDGWFHTGDMARLDDDGYIFIVDRKKDMILSGGFNIYSKEVEMTIASLEGIGDVAVVGVPDDIYGEAVVAFIEAAPGERAPSMETIIAHCRESIASYKKPKYVFFRDSLPRNAVGKVLKHQLSGEARDQLARNQPGMRGAS